MLSGTKDVSIAELDEAIAHLFAALKVDEFGSRMDWRKRQLLESSIDDLLDARLEAMSESKDNDPGECAAQSE